MRAGMRNLWVAFILLGLGTAVLLAGQPALAGPQVYTMGTGGEGGLYLPMGRDLAALVNQGSKDFQIEVVPSKGSVQNIQWLAEGKFNLGIGQADLALEAYEGKLAFEQGKPYTGLRALFGLHTEAVTLIASKKSGIKWLEDLKGKRVGLGAPGSGTLDNSLFALELVGLTKEDLAEAALINPKKAAELFKQGKLDAFFYTVGHPNKLVSDISACKGVQVYLVGVHDVLSKVILEYDQYVMDRVSNIHYPQVLNRTGVETFGIKALLLVDEKAPDALVTAVVETMLNRLPELKAKQPALLFVQPGQNARGRHRALASGGGQGLSGPQDDEVILAG